MKLLADCSTWPECLFEIYKTSRHSIGWAIMYENHDEEDQGYFKLLDSYIGTKGEKRDE